MKPKYLIAIFIFIALLVLFPLVRAYSGLNIFKKTTRVKLTPVTIKNYQLEGEDAVLKQGYFRERERWLVFSDRAGNNTFKSAGSEVQLKTLGFMDPCYVIRQKKDYLELIKYDPKLLKDPHKGTIDFKSAEYLGWVHKSRLLLWRAPLQDVRTGFVVKGITCFKGEKAIGIPGPYAGNESLLLFSGPVQREMIGACNMEDLFYIFKQSEDGNHYLVGRSAQITADNCHDAVGGWISKGLVKPWGERSFFTQTAAPEKGPQSEQEVYGNIPFFTSPVMPADTIPGSALSTCCGAGQLLERIYPVQARPIQANGKEIMKTGVLANILDRSENEVMNLVGHNISYNSVNCMLSCQHNANIVFVVDGNSRGGMATVLTAVQSMERFFDTCSRFTSYKFGGVVYKNNVNGRCDTAMPTLSAAYPDLKNFFSKCRNDQYDCNVNQVVQTESPGLSRAARLLRPYKRETNIIVIIGDKGNSMTPGGYIDISQQLVDMNTRLLIYQTYGGSDRGYNDFFVQARNLIEGTAEAISERKKEKLVNPEDKLSKPGYTLKKGDSGVYYLDFPGDAITQGFLLFPENERAMQSSFLVKSLDSLMIQIYDDNERMEKSLTRDFSNGSSAGRIRIQAPYRFLYPAYGDAYLPPSFLKDALSVDAQPFYMPAWVENPVPNDSSANLKFGLLVSAAEYEQVIRSLSSLGDPPGDSSRSRRVMYRHLRRQVRRYRSAYHTSVGGRIKRLSIAGSLEYMTGYKSMNPRWLKNELRMIKKEKYISRAEVVSFITKCREKAHWLTDNTQNKSIQFYNNGQVYYWLTAANLP